MSHCRQHAGPRREGQSPGGQDDCQLADTSAGAAVKGRDGVSHGPFGQNLAVTSRRGRYAGVGGEGGDRGGGSRSAGGAEEPASGGGGGTGGGGAARGPRAAAGAGRAVVGGPVVGGPVLGGAVVGAAGRAAGGVLLPGPDRALGAAGSDLGRP